MIRALVAALVLTLAAPGSAAPATPFDPAPILKAAGFNGFVLVARGDTVLWQTPRATCPQAPRDEIMLCHPRDPAEMRWPWASVTKQVMAVLAMQQVDRGRLALDTPASTYLPALRRGGTAPTVRQLLQHRAGLRNPDDSAEGVDEWPVWYTGEKDQLRWCLNGRTAPGGDWRYNNCDTLVLGAILEKVGGRSVPALFAERIAKPTGMDTTRFAGPVRAAVVGTTVTITPQEQRVFARFGAAGGLIGSPHDLLRFDRALMTGMLISPAARATMWQGDPKLGFMALAQWSFDASLKGCAAPVRLIERRGGIGRFQIRNILLPDRDMTVMLFTAVGEDKFDFGEIWQGKGLSHDLLSTVACS